MLACPGLEGLWNVGSPATMALPGSKRSSRGGRRDHVDHLSAGNDQVLYFLFDCC